MTKEKQPVPDPSERKKFMFYDTNKRQVDLRIRLKYDGMNQSQFFRAIITGYLEKDEGILDYLDRYKDKYQVQGQKKRAGSRLLVKKGRAMEKQFGLNDDEIENIFDILEKEHPEI
jgi:hypothetical protein